VVPWIYVIVVSFVSILIWFNGRKKPKQKWTNVEKVLFIFFIIAEAIDVFQTYFSVVVTKIAIELNPLFGPGFDLLSGILAKSVLIIFVFLLLRIHKPINSRKKFFISLRLFGLIAAVVIQWVVVILNEAQLYRFVYDISKLLN